jgi:hypothetical protein
VTISPAILTGELFYKRKLLKIEDIVSNIFHLMWMVVDVKPARKETINEMVFMWMSNCIGETCKVKRFKKEVLKSLSTERHDAMF